MKYIKKISVISLCLLIFSCFLTLDCFAAVTPAKPLRFKAASVTASSARLVWNPVFMADGYRVYVEKNGKKTKLADTTEREYTAKGLTASTTYTFYVRSKNVTGGKTVFSNEFAKLTLKTDALVAAKLTGASGATYIKLNWNKVPGATSYRIYAKNGNKTELIKKLKANTNSFTVKDLTPDTSYSFIVRAVTSADGKGITGPASNTLSLKTQRANLVKLKVSKVSASSVSLAWSKAEDATGYRVYSYNDGKWVKAAEVKSASTLSFTVKAKSDRVNKFRVRPFKKTGDDYWWFVYSNTCTVTTPPSKADLKVYRTDELRQVFSKNFTLSYKSESARYGKVNVTLSKSGSKYYLYSKVDGVDYALLNIESGNYVVLKQQKSYLKAPKAMNSVFDIKSAVDDLLPSKKLKATAVLSEFEGKAAVCEVFSNIAKTKVLKYYYVCGELVGIEQYTSGKLSERAIVTQLRKTALSGVFKIPDGYKKISAK